ncbi:MAG: tRNA uridine-5-carboxymethylaminomethyl(34) synthesis GTPase MnmE [Verrucomicrobiota bacterium]
MNDTFHALATVPGTSAIGVIRVTGSKVVELIRGSLDVDVSEKAFRKAILGTYRVISGTPVDQVLWTYFPPYSSYTGRDLVEISCHGNMFLVEQILWDLERRGSRPAEPGEFTKTAFLEGRMDLSQAEAVADLIAARSEAAVLAAQKQLAGGLGHEIESCVSRILSVLAEIEAYIDFPEEDLPGETTDGPRKELAVLISRLGEMIATGRQRELLHRGIRTVLLGEVNAGKSSLLNRLLGEERAIVSATPGTTRDFLEDSFTLGRFCIQIFDTAGIRESADEIEREGVRRTQRLAGNADFNLVVMDGTEDCPTLPPEIQAGFTEENTLLVFNKCDLPEFSMNPSFYPQLRRVSLSATEGMGVSDFLSIWESMIREDMLKGAEDRVLYNQRHIGYLKECQTALERARLALQEKTSTEYVAPELRDALDALGSIVGTVDNEAMLDVLFGEFCIGK